VGGGFGGGGAAVSTTWGCVHRPACGVGACDGGGWGKLARLVEGARGPAGDFVVVASRGFAAFARRDCEGVVAELGAVMGEHERFGGSRAQRELLEYAMACGLMRVGRGEEARG